MEKPGIKPATSGLQGIALIHYTTAASFICMAKFFCGFSGSKPVPTGWFKICVGFITGTPEGSTESGFYGEAGIQTCDPWFTRHSAYTLHHSSFFYLHSVSGPY